MSLIIAEICDTPIQKQRYTVTVRCIYTHFKKKIFLRCKFDASLALALDSRLYKYNNN